MVSVSIWSLMRTIGGNRETLLCVLLSGRFNWKFKSLVSFPSVLSVRCGGVKFPSQIILIATEEDRWL